MSGTTYNSLRDPTVPNCQSLGFFGNQDSGAYHLCKVLKPNQKSES